MISISSNQNQYIQYINLNKERIICMHVLTFISIFLPTSSGRCLLVVLRRESDQIGQRSPGVVPILHPKLLRHGQDLPTFIYFASEKAVHQSLDRPDLRVGPAIQIHLHICHTYTIYIKTNNKKVMLSI